MPLASSCRHSSRLPAVKNGGREVGWSANANPRSFEPARPELRLARTHCVCENPKSLDDQIGAPDLARLLVSSFLSATRWHRHAKNLPTIISIFPDWLFIADN